MSRDDLKPWNKRNGLGCLDGDGNRRQGGETVTRAMVWGTGRGRALAEIGTDGSGAISHQKVKQVVAHGKSDCRA